MVFFITVLRALATCLITNSHYTGVYPTDLIANGGLIGDILFFAVSGYCLYNVRLSFPRWYGKRLWRVMLPVWIATAVFMAIGAYSLNVMPWYRWYLYPTYYHFVASILVLYVPFYCIVKIPFLQKHLTWVMGGIALLAVGIYCLFYDRSYYHIDTVREPFVRFLFLESMLLGALFRQNDARFRCAATHNRLFWLLSAICFAVYFASKIVFSRFSWLSQWQIVNYAAIFALLYCLFRAFAGADVALEKMPRFLKAILSFLADMTLEIYLVQYVLIDYLRPLFGFPINWFVLTASILAAAYLLHTLCQWIYKATDRLLGVRQKKEASA